MTVMLKLMSKILNKSKILYLKLSFRTKKFVKVDNYPTWPAQKEHTKCVTMNTLVPSNKIFDK